MKKACMSNVKDPENRSKKLCVCGGHSVKAKNAKKGKLRRVAKNVSLDADREMLGKDADYFEGEDVGDR
jgi:hypothetical protein